MDYVTSVERDWLALAEAAEGNHAAEVAGCPGWTVADLVWHVREVHWFWGTIVAELLSEPPPEERGPSRPDDPDRLLADYQGGVTRLAAVLRAADPTAPCWTWAEQKDVAFVVRHQAQEAAVHRWDAEVAAGHESPIDAEIAADAVSEFLTFSTGWVREGSAPLPGPVRLVASDTGASWRITEDGERRLAVRPDDGDSEAVASVGGTASDLLLGLYRRVGAQRFRIAGDVIGWTALVERNDTE